MEKILIVDDDPQVIDVLKSSLERAGYAVSGAASGGEAVRKCRDQDFALVICDILMPNKGGFETIAEIRKCCSTIKVIAISGGGVVPGALYLRAVSLLGADRTLEKPFVPKAVVTTVRELIGDPRPTGSAEAT